MSKLRVGVIGLGVGEAHVEACVHHPNAELVAVCDFVSAKCESIRSKFGSAIQSTTQASEILKASDIDLVVIASCDNYHADQVLEGIAAGKHLFVEKPLCQFREEALEISKELKLRPHQKLSSNYILRTSPRFINVCQRVRNQELGELFYLDGDYNYGRLKKITSGWRGEIPYYSVIAGGAAHVLDLMLWMTRQKVIKVSAVGNQIASRNTLFRHKDLVVGLLEFESGLTAKIGANFGAVYPHFHKLSIYGTRATFENRLDGGYLFTHRDALDDKDYSIHASSHNEEPIVMKDPYPGVHKGALLQNFIEAIVQQKEAIVTSSEVFDVMAVCFALEESAKNFSTVEVCYF